MSRSRFPLVVYNAVRIIPAKTIPPMETQIRKILGGVIRSVFLSATTRLQTNTRTLYPHIPIFLREKRRPSHPPSPLPGPDSIAPTALVSPMLKYLGIAMSAPEPSSAMMGSTCSQGVSPDLVHLLEASSLHRHVLSAMSTPEAPRCCALRTY